MGGSPTNGANSGSDDSLGLQSTKAWHIPSSHPEYLSQGLEKGISNMASGISNGAIMAFNHSQKPNDTGGYDTKSAVKSAAPYAYGQTQVPGMGWIPQAKGINYQPDQWERLYGNNYSGTGS
jgi:hypothetical protein